MVTLLPSLFYILMAISTRIDSKIADNSTHYYSDLTRLEPNISAYFDKELAKLELELSREIPRISKSRFRRHIAKAEKLEIQWRNVNYLTVERQTKYGVVVGASVEQKFLNKRKMGCPVWKYYANELHFTDSVEVDGPVSVESFTVSGEPFWIFALNSEENLSDLAMRNTRLYKLHNDKLEIVQTFLTIGTTAWKSFRMDSDLFLAEASFRFEGSNIGIKCNKTKISDPAGVSIYMWKTKGFVKVKSLELWKVVDIDTCSAGGKKFFVAASRNLKGSVLIYKITRDRDILVYELFQELPATYGIKDVECFESQGKLFLAVANEFESSPKFKDLGTYSTIYIYNGLFFESFQQIATRGAKKWTFLYNVLHLQMQSSGEMYSLWRNMWVQVPDNIFEENAISALDDVVVVIADNATVSVRKLDISTNRCDILKEKLGNLKVIKDSAANIVRKTIENITKILEISELLRRLETENRELQREIEFVNSQEGFLSLTLKNMKAKTITSEKISLRRMNSVNISEFTEEVVTIKDGDVISGLYFEKVELLNATIGPNNGQVPLDLVLTDQSNVFSSVKQATSLFIQDLMITGRFDGILPKDMMLTSGDQTLHGNLYTGDVKTSRLSSKLVNGVDWINDVVAIDRGGSVTSPKIFNQAVDVRSDLQISGKINGFPANRLDKVVTVNEEAIISVPMSWKEVVFADDLAIVDGKMNGLIIPKDLSEIEPRSYKAFHGNRRRRILRQLAVQNLDCAEVEVTGTVFPKIPLWASNALRVTDEYLAFKSVNFTGKVNFPALEVPKEVLSHLVPLNSQSEGQIASVTFDGKVLFTRDIEVGGLINGVNVSTLKDTVVTVDGHQTIYGSVVFETDIDASTVTFKHSHSDVMNIEGPLEVSRVKCKFLMADVLNGHDPQLLFLDTLMDTSARQVVTGWKSFNQISSDKNSSLTVDGSFNVLGIDFKQFVEEAVLLTADIKVVPGPVKFTDIVQLEHLMSGKINGVDMKSLYEGSLMKDEWRTLRVANADAKRLYAQKVNDVHVNQLYENAVLKTSRVLPRNTKFHRIVVEDSLMLRTLDGVLFSEYVVKNPKMTSIITGCKTFAGHVHICGDLTIKKLNSGDQVMLPRVLEASTVIFQDDLTTDGYWCDINWRRFWDDVVFIDSPIRLSKITHMSFVELSSVDIDPNLQEVLERLETNDHIIINFWDEVTFKRLLLEQDIEFHVDTKIENLPPETKSLRFENVVTVEGDVSVSGHWSDEPRKEAFESVRVERLTVDGSVLGPEGPSCSLCLEGGDSIECRWCQMRDTLPELLQDYSSRIFQGFELIRPLRDCRCVFNVEDSLIALLRVGVEHYEFVEAVRNLDGNWTSHRITDFHIHLGEPTECLHFTDSNNDTVILIVFNNVVEIWKLRKTSGGQISIVTRQKKADIGNFQSLQVVTLQGGGTLLFALMDNSSLAVYTWHPITSSFHSKSRQGSRFRLGRVKIETVNDSPMIVIATADGPEWTFIAVSKWDEKNEELVSIGEKMVNGHLDTLTVCGFEDRVVGARLSVDGQLLVTRFGQVFEDLPTSYASFLNVQCLKFADRLWLLAESETSLQIFRHPDYVEPVKTYARRTLTSVSHLKMAGFDVLFWKASGDIFWKSKSLSALDKKCQKCHREWHKTCGDVANSETTSDPFNVKPSTLPSTMDHYSNTRGTVTFTEEITKAEVDATYFHVAELMFADSNQTWTPSVEDDTAKMVTRPWFYNVSKHPSARKMTVPNVETVHHFNDVTEAVASTEEIRPTPSSDDLDTDETPPRQPIGVTTPEDHEGTLDTVATRQIEETGTDFEAKGTDEIPAHSPTENEGMDRFSTKILETSFATVPTSFLESGSFSTNSAPDVTGTEDYRAPTDAVVAYVSATTPKHPASLLTKTTSEHVATEINSPGGCKTLVPDVTTTTTSAEYKTTMKTIPTAPRINVADQHKESVAPSTVPTTDTTNDTMETYFSYSPTPSENMSTFHGEDGTEREVTFSDLPTEDLVSRAIVTTTSTRPYPTTVIPEKTEGVPQWLLPTTTEADKTNRPTSDSETRVVNLLKTSPSSFMNTAPLLTHYVSQVVGITGAVPQDFVTSDMEESPSPTFPSVTEFQKSASIMDTISPVHYPTVPTESSVSITLLTYESNVSVPKEESSTRTPDVVTTAPREGEMTKVQTAFSLVTDGAVLTGTTPTSNDYTSVDADEINPITDHSVVLHQETNPEVDNAWSMPVTGTTQIPVSSHDHSTHLTSNGFGDVESSQTGFLSLLTGISGITDTDDNAMPPLTTEGQNIMTIEQEVTSSDMRTENLKEGPTESAKTTFDTISSSRQTTPLLNKLDTSTPFDVDVDETESVSDWLPTTMASKSVVGTADSDTSKIIFTSYPSIHSQPTLRRQAVEVAPSAEQSVGVFSTQPYTEIGKATTTDYPMTEATMEELCSDSCNPLGTPQIPPSESSVTAVPTPIQPTDSQPTNYDATKTTYADYVTPTVAIEPPTHFAPTESSTVFGTVSQSRSLIETTASPSFKVTEQHASKIPSTVATGIHKTVDLARTSPEFPIGTSSGSDSSNELTVTDELHNVKGTTSSMGAIQTSVSATETTVPPLSVTQTTSSSKLSFTTDGSDIEITGATPKMSTPLEQTSTVYTSDFSSQTEVEMSDSGTFNTDTTILHDVTGSSSPHLASNIDITSTLAAFTNIPTLGTEYETLKETESSSSFSQETPDYTTEFNDVTTQGMAFVLSTGTGHLHSSESATSTFSTPGTTSTKQDTVGFITVSSGPSSFTSAITDEQATDVGSTEMPVEGHLVSTTTLNIRASASHDIIQTPSSAIGGITEWPPRTVSPISAALTDRTSAVSGTKHTKTFPGETSRSQDTLTTKPTYSSAKEVTSLLEQSEYTGTPAAKRRTKITDSLDNLKETSPLIKQTRPTSLINPTTSLDPDSDSPNTVHSSNIFLTTRQVEEYSSGDSLTDSTVGSADTQNYVSTNVYPEVSESVGSDVPIDMTKWTTDATDRVDSWLSTRETPEPFFEYSEGSYEDALSTPTENDSPLSYSKSSYAGTETIPRTVVYDGDSDGAPVKCGTTPKFGGCQQEDPVAYHDMEYMQEEEDLGREQVTDLPEIVGGLRTDLVIDWLRSRSYGFKSRLCHLAGICNNQES